MNDDDSLGVQITVVKCQCSNTYNVFEIRGCLDFKLWRPKNFL